jgi:phosphatidylglycerophosphate synthase
VIDAQLRVQKEAVLGPVAGRLPSRISPISITLLAVVPGIGAALAAADGRNILAVGLWLLNRLLDGLDGTLARQRDRQSDLGAYLDILMDFLVYAAVPIGLAAHADSQTTWIAAAALLAAFYVNTISWAYLSALLERRERNKSREYTSVTMPGGLIEGAETVVLYAIMLAVPAGAPMVFWVMAAAVAITVGQRVVWAVRNL